MKERMDNNYNPEEVAIASPSDHNNKAHHATIQFRYRMQWAAVIILGAIINQLQ